MPTQRRSGPVAFRLAVLFVTTSCAASQQQQPQSVVLDSTPVEQLWRFIEQAVRSELQPLLSRLESRVDALDSKLESRMDALDSRLVVLDSRVDVLDSRLDVQESQLDKLIIKVDKHNSQLEFQTTRMDGATNKTVRQQTQIDELAVRLDQLEGELGESGRQQLVRDCSDLPVNTPTGTFLLQPGLDRSLPPLLSYCETDTSGGKWTVFQRRVIQQRHQDFYLGWRDYREGFGELSSEFWWGLKSLRKMTSAQDRKYELRIDIENFEGEKRHAVYQDFQLSAEEDGYRLSVGNYSGNAGDGLRYHVNSKFSTRDIDQDRKAKGSCAQIYKGAWWYGDCGPSSLNGRYLYNPVNNWEGIWWNTWEGDTYSLKKTEMKLRRV